MEKGLELSVVFVGAREIEGEGEDRVDRGLRGMVRERMDAWVGRGEMGDC